MKHLLVVLLMLGSLSLADGQSAQPTTPSPAALAYGEGQLNQVLKDRPQLVGVVKKGEPIWNWLVAAFAYMPDGSHIQWDNSAMSATSQSVAESSAYADAKGLNYVKVRQFYWDGAKKGQPLRAEEILGGLVYELINVTYPGEKIKITRAVEEGKISRDDFIRGCAEIEFHAAQKEVEVFRTVWLPYCQANGIPYSPRLWHVPLDATFTQWIAKYPRDYWYPWGNYGRVFDLIDNERIGVFKRQNGDFDGAIAALTLALPLGPDVYFQRYYAYRYKGDDTNALADINHIMELCPDQADSYNMLAWFLATCPQAPFRDGKKAVENATRAVEMSHGKDPNCIDTLAAAYAEAGDFDRAVETENKYLLCAGIAANNIADAKKRIALYQSHQPFRQGK